MKLSTFSSRMPNYFKTGKCYNLKSMPGRGKTSVVSTAPAVIKKALGLDIGFTLLSGPLLNPTDTVGYLIPTKDHMGNPASFFTKPFWWYIRQPDGSLKGLDEYPHGGVVFVDEEDKMDVDMKKVIGEMALSGRCGPHILPPNWVVWMAGNRKKDRSGSTKDLDHLINRRCEINIDDDLQSWLDWGMARGLNAVAMTFAEQNSHIVFSKDLPKEQGPWCTPRSFVECIEHLEAFADADGRLPADVNAQMEAAGFIGHGEAAQLFATIQLEHQMPKLADIISDPNKAQLPNKPDGQMLVAYSLAARANAANLDAVMTYIERMPKEFVILWARSATTRDELLVSEPAFEGWCQRNASLMRLIRA